MTLRTVLLSLQALLAAAEPDDPQDAVVANQVRYSVDCDFVTILSSLLSQVGSQGLQEIQDFKQFIVKLHILSVSCYSVLCSF